MRPSRSPVLWFFTLACVLAGAGKCFVDLYLAHRFPLMTWARCAPYLTGTSPSIAGLLMVIWLYGWRGVPKLVLQLNLRPINKTWRMLTVCLLLPLGVAVLTVSVLARFGFTAPHLAPHWLTGYLYTAVIGEGFAGAGLFEEIGWRGFALPHLQRRYSALVSSLIIGLVWACWHFQNFFALDPFPVFVDPFPWTEVMIYVPTVMVYSVIFTWVYNSTEGSLSAVVVLHGAIDAQEHLFSWGDLPKQAVPPQMWLGLPYLVIAAGLVWRYGATNLSWRNRVVAGKEKTPTESG